MGKRGGLGRRGFVRTEGRTGSGVQDPEFSAQATTPDPPEASELRVKAPASLAFETAPMEFGDPSPTTTPCVICVPSAVVVWLVGNTVDGTTDVVGLVWLTAITVAGVGLLCIGVRLGLAGFGNSNG